MQRDSLILALFILAVVICLGLTILPKIKGSVSGTAEKIKTAHVEQAVRA